ncbi:MAG: hypothetical protein ABIQ33_12605, partial [Caldimonas sp.]
RAMSSSMPLQVGRSSPIADALDTNEQATEEVKTAADELTVVHAVLDTKLSQDKHDAEVRKAVADTDSLAKRLDETAEKLGEVNETLQREMGRS